MRVTATRIAAAGPMIAMAIASAGCFYVDPINQRPSLDIRPMSSDPVFRGATVGFEAIASDPEQQVVAFQWRAYVCTDATVIEQCDLDPIFTGVEGTAVFSVPAFRADPDGPGPMPARPVESLRVVLEGRDDHGATAKPAQELILPVLNNAPKLQLRTVSKFGPVVGTPIDVYARYSDSDDTPTNVTLEWTAFSPSQVPDTLVDLPALPPDGSGNLQQGKRFTPAVTGNWDIRVVATDRLGARTEEHHTVTVADDAPPCLDAWDPIAGPAATPITEPTLFQVVHVRDDLDAYPRLGPEPFLREAAFEWSMKVGAGPRLPLANTVNSLAFDPQAYVPGTIVELRVEIFDRKDIAITCADDVQTCSVISQPSCIQRQTWRVEAR